ncbi:hypothetical protein [Chitinophaga ginsengisegetis]|uniref:hypothetical protein n=1 Tax=Chitinophaga ginsengisegetis TaxID=393003 RepID=UPI000DB95509|nr:hypothetical protein [Chitinophaga ginsengisegetis]MDR6565457.1 hypothetical protein [Chitinophaga ginsengisegetis]MDR6645185.1 hypothetical protein [Chitinophaga ginsengisegetis]MDR6652223.1 hypothetical protein [Chitinophaga ginsengisegetis]
MITVIYKGHEYRVAESWDELSGKQFLEIISILLSSQQGELAELKILQVLLQVSARFICKIPADQLTGIMHLVRGFQEDMQLTRQLVPFIKVGKKLYGPAAAFENMTAAEFHFADMHYQEWKATGADEALSMFLAVLYRPVKQKYDVEKDPDGDRREKFNANTTAFYSRYTSRLSRGVMLAIIFQYESWRRQMEENYKDVFNHQSDHVSNIQAGWFGVFRGVAGDGKYGEMEKVEQIPIHTLLLELQFLIEEAAALKAQQENLFNK